MLDGDEAGREGVAAISSQLIEQVFVRIVLVPDGSQPDELSSDAIRELLAST
jgi:DNA primase